MRVRDLDSIFGIPVSLLKTQTTRYNVSIVLCSVLDVLLIVVSGVLLFLNGDPSSFIKASVIVAVVVNILLITLTSGENTEAIYFYKSHKRDKVVAKTYDIDASKLYSVLFCSGYKGIKAEQSLDKYKEALNSACLRNKKYSKKLYKYLSRYESDNGAFKVWVSCRGYYIGERSELNE